MESRAIEILSRPPLQKVPDSVMDSYGHHFEALYMLFPVLLFFQLSFVLRHFCKNTVFPPLARMCGLTGKAVPKFGYQGWLLLFYTTSTIYGYLILHDKSWVSFPLGENEKREMTGNFRSTPHTEIVWYYCYQIGFFLAELHAICTEPKRSDFLEYLLHHIVTLYLLIFSFAAYEHRIGSYVLLIHDVVDIFLCLAKMANYMKVRDLIMVPTFVTFVVSYTFFRMYCLPVASMTLFQESFIYHGNVASTCLGYVLGFALQALHVFWYGLILRVLYRAVATGKKEDVRSDDDVAEQPSSPSKTISRSGAMKRSKTHQG
eukprot:GILI01005193.1.p1 GENE.GILI01005193.1~~GILI01005193.1.p1  ORF type:complete len:335 (-),score=50.91 GILI01005193.1:217-1167(-)